MIRKPEHPIKNNPDWGKVGLLSMDEKDEKRAYDRQCNKWRAQSKRIEKRFNLLMSNIGNQAKLNELILRSVIVALLLTLSFVGNAQGQGEEVRDLYVLFISLGSVLILALVTLFILVFYNAYKLERLRRENEKRGN